ncbi:MAG TPA: FtsW/RodA/SpoVE family cell cycle protein, partial [Pyrinomonadaceae bacterium]|nr:FtsW/RodA/SpoVE family cell cycle protein [Pyrinomonadaceae bacterium]
MARKLAPDKWLFAATIGLALFGVVMVYSASAVIAQKENGNQFYYVIKQGVWVAIGFIVMLLAMQFNYQQLKNRRIVYTLLILCTLGLVSVFGFSSTNGAHRWIKLPGLSLQPSEISKLALIIFLAYFLEKRAGEEGDFWRTFLPCGVVTGGLAALVVIEPDFGTAMMLALIFTVVIYTAGARVLHLAMAAAPALVVAAGLLIFVPWRLKRLITFLDPWA